MRRSSTILKQDSSSQCKTKIYLTYALVDSLTGLSPRNTWEYKPPAAKDIPQDFRVTLLPNARNPHGVLSSKVERLDFRQNPKKLIHRRRESQRSWWESLSSSPSGMLSTQAGCFFARSKYPAHRASKFLTGKTAASLVGGSWVSFYCTIITDSILNNFAAERFCSSENVDKISIPL